MKKTTLCALAAIVIPVSMAAGQADRNGSPVLKGPYLGQKPPGLTPEMFAPGVISRQDHFEHSAALFSPDGTEVYWSAKPNDQRYYRIFVMTMDNGIWSEPRVAEFCLEDRSYESVTLSADGRKLYYVGEGEQKYVEKENGAWSKPRPIPSPIDSEAEEKIWSIVNDGSVYFIRFPGHDVFVSRPVDGNYAAPEKLGPEINSSDARESSVYVSPDESTMIIEATKDAATAELFVSFRKDDGSWSERVKLPIAWGRFPSVSPDGKYLFFMTREGIYWVSAKIVESVRNAPGPAHTRAGRSTVG